MTSLHRRSVVALTAASILALLAGLLSARAALATPAVTATQAQTQSTAQEVAQGVQDDALFVGSGAKNFLSAGDVDALRTELSRTDAPVYMAVLPEARFDSDREVERFAGEVGNAAGQAGTYAVAALAGPDGGHLGAVSSTLSREQIERLVQEASSAGQNGGAAAVLTDFVQRADSAATDERSGADSGGESAAAGSAAGGFPWSGLFLAVLVLGGVTYYGVSRRRRKHREAEQLQEVRHAADEDVTRLGEDITALDLDIGGQRIDDDTRADYEHALDAYDTAKRRVDAAQRPEDLRGVSTAVEDGRFVMTCVRARLTGEPLPERRAPCFFNPQHGPSVTDVEWTPPGGTAREVPVCAADAQRLARGEEPEAREVVVDGQRRPYWEAGSGYAPWFGGYYGGFGMGGMLPGLLMGTMLGSSLGGFGMGDHGDVGGDFGGGFEGGGGDFGGFGGGGGDFGGFGGGDFGGGGF